MPTQLEQQKKAIRQQVRLIRKQISSQQAHKAALAIQAQLKQYCDYPKAKQIACFLSFDGEIDTRPLIEMIISEKGQCFLPKLRPYQPNRLWFMPFDNNTPLRNNRFGIPEVDLAVNHAIAISKIDILLIPLVAFDKHANRLGMGGGFYDATLAHLAEKKQRPQCIGVAFEQQRVDSVPTQPWDFPLDGVLTPERFYPRAT